MTDIKKQIRPEIPSIIKTEHFSMEEKFQNEVLRPIIKFQHALLLSYFEHYYLKRTKVTISELNSTQKKEVIQKIFKVDTQLKTELRGLIIGLFTVEEYKEYLGYSSKLNRRINNMIQQRIDSCYAT
jgi:hypothetical protein